jgi:hypothetical protein
MLRIVITNNTKLNFYASIYISIENLGNIIKLKFIIIHPIFKERFLCIQNLFFSRTSSSLHFSSFLLALSRSYF